MLDSTSNRRETFHQEATGGLKDRQGKPMGFYLLPWDALGEVGRAMYLGARKYGQGNWKLGLTHSHLLDAAYRHINAYAQGERLDKETGCNHLAHAVCNLLFIIWYVKNKKGNDDLPIPTPDGLDFKPPEDKREPWELLTMPGQSY